LHKEQKKGKSGGMGRKRSGGDEDEHYSNLFTVGPMIRHNDINKQS
jgi:hypothetical protein